MTSANSLMAIERLRRVSIFASSSTHVLAALADVVEDVHLAPDEQLFAKGDLGSSMYVIATGLVRVHIGKQTVVELSDGDIVGELAALDPQPRAASVSAIEPTTLYRIEQATLQSLMAGHPEIMHGIIRELARRLRETSAPYRFF